MTNSVGNKATEGDKEQLINVLTLMISDIRASGRLIDYEFNQDTDAESVSLRGQMVYSPGRTKVDFRVIYESLPTSNQFNASKP